MAKERYRYIIRDLDDGRQMLIRLHVGANGMPASPTVALVLPCEPEEGALTVSFAQIDAPKGQKN